MTSSPEPPAASDVRRDFAESRIFARIAGFLLLYKLAFFALVGVLIHFLPTIYSLGSYQAHSRGSVTSRAVAPPTAGLWRYFETWDAHHYLHLARFGYGDQPMSLAFYPLWPALIRLAAPLFGGNFTLTALVLANAFSIGALALLHRLVARRTDEDIAGRTLLLLLAFPGALFLCLPYSESLFLLLCVALFWQLDGASARIAIPVATRADWRLAGGVAACAMGAAFARPTGLFLIVPLALWAWMRRDEPVWRAVALAPLVGVAGYFLTIYLATGDVTAGFAAQKLFSAQPTIGKLLDVPGFVRGFFDLSAERRGRAYFHDRVWFVLFCCTLWPLWKRDKLWFSFAVTMGIVTAFGASMMSFMRYFSVIFPCFVVIANWFGAPRARLVFPLILALFFLLQVYFVTLQINYFWVS